MRRLLAGAQPGEQVVDLCAGAGGKTLALAAMMQNHGPDLRDRYRQAPACADPCAARTRRCAQRAGAHPARCDEVLDDLEGSIDLVLIDAPCTGTGSWRRNPDAKWRLRPGALDTAAEGPGCCARPCGAAGQTRRPHRLCHLLGAGGGERRADPRFPRPPRPSFPWKSRPRS